MSREALETLLDRVVPADAQERADLARMRSAARELAAPFSRKQPGAHFTGSALVVDPSLGRVCLILHRKLQRWLQPGGHAEEGDGGDLAATALREAREETGLLVSLHPTAPRPFDVDIHTIPGREDEAEHCHLDVRFLLVAERPEALQRDLLETAGAQWVGLEEALEDAREPAMARLLRKVQTQGLSSK